MAVLVSVTRAPEILGTALTLATVLFFSYLPFLYATEAIRIDKELIAAVLYAVSSTLAVVGMVRARFVRTEIFVLCVSLLLFPVYSIFRLVAFNHPVDGGVHSLIGQVILNPLAGLLALYIRQRVDDAIRILWIMCAVIGGFALRTVLVGGFSGLGFVNLFPGLELQRAAYQLPANYIAILVLIEFAILLDQKPGAARRLFSCAVIILGCAALFRIGSRSSIAAVGTIFTSVLGYRFVRSMWKRMDVKILATIFVSILIVAPVLPYAVSRLETSWGFARFAILENGTDSSLRIFLFTHAWTMWTSSLGNLVFGAGPTAFQQFGSGSIHAYPHDIFLELLVDYGVVGAGLFFAPFAFVVWINRRHQAGPMTWATRSSLYIFLLFALAALFTGTIRSCWELIFFAMLLVHTDQGNPADEGSMN